MHALSTLAVIARLALRDLTRRWRIMLALGTMVTLTVLSVTLLHGYTHSIEVRFRSAQPRLVVQQDSTVGEFAGSRIPAAVGDALLAVLSQVTRIPVDRISPDHSLAEPGLDSIVSMQVFNEITRQFGVRIFVAEMQAFKTVGELVGYLQQEIAAHAPAPVLRPPALQRPPLAGSHRALSPT